MSQLDAWHSDKIFICALCKMRIYGTACMHRHGACTHWGCAEAFVINSDARRHELRCRRVQHCEGWNAHKPHSSHAHCHQMKLTHTSDTNFADSHIPSAKCSRRKHFSSYSLWTEGWCGAPELRKKYFRFLKFRLMQCLPGRRLSGVI